MVLNRDSALQQTLALTSFPTISSYQYNYSLECCQSTCAQQGKELILAAVGM